MDESDREFSLALYQAVYLPEEPTDGGGGGDKRGSNSTSKGSGMSPGAVAAFVVILLLVAVGVALGLFWHFKGKDLY